jgi:hypothetical protein
MVPSCGGFLVAVALLLRLLFLAVEKNGQGRGRAAGEWERKAAGEALGLPPHHIYTDAVALVCATEEPRCSQALEPVGHDHCPSTIQISPRANQFYCKNASETQTSTPSNS